MRLSPNRILLSRTDNIGDVVLTLPLAGILKQYFPDSTIYFLGKKYTEPIIQLSQHIDHFLNWDELQLNDSEKKLHELKIDTIIHIFPQSRIARIAKKAKIKNRIGTSHRLYHWWTCNRLVPIGRKNSDLHEAQLNLQLLAPLGIPTSLPLDAFIPFYGIQNQNSPSTILTHTNSKKYNLIFHPKSNQSAREWPASSYLQLAQLLDPNQFQIILTGTATERQLLNDECPELLQLPHVNDTMGQLSLSELIQLIQAADGLLAASTGPLHIAAALGKQAIGLYPSIRPVHPGRWSPLGKQAIVLESGNYCGTCKEKKTCTCMHSIMPEHVLNLITQLQSGVGKLKRENILPF